MKILIYGINYAPELTGIGKYTGEMAAFYAAQGDEVEVITAPPYYPNWEIHPAYRGGWRKESMAGVQVLRCPLYVPKKVTGTKRILHEFSFVLSSLRYWIPRYFRKYDLILCVSPPFHLGFIALPHQWFQGTPVINHIQDLQVDAARDLGMIRQEKLLRLLERAERWLLRRVQRVSTISSGMLTKIAEKGLKADRIVMFPNWVDATKVHPVAREASARADWGYQDDDHLVMYAGNMGEKQGLENILLAADQLRDVPKLHFIIIGEGGAKDRLVAQAEDLSLTNVHFKPLQPLDRLAATLAAADVHLILQKRAAADLVMPSKLTNILAVGGHALVTAEPGSTLYDTVSENQLGTIVAPESVPALVQGIRDILSGQRANDRIGAQTFADEKLNKENILNRFKTSLSNTPR
ncbi:MAG: WcaI family glycosyltransferase [Bacteroidota bacterium]